MCASFVWIDRATERKGHEVTKAGGQLPDMIPRPSGLASMVSTIRPPVLSGALGTLGSRQTAQQLPGFLAQETRCHGTRMDETIRMLVKDKFAMGIGQNSLKNKNSFAAPAEDSLDARFITVLSDTLVERRGAAIVKALAV